MDVGDPKMGRPYLPLPSFVGPDGQMVTEVKDHTSVILHDAEPRRGKTYGLLKRVTEQNRPAVIAVPTVGSLVFETEERDGQEKWSDISTARDIEDDKIPALAKDPDLDSVPTVIQAHGIPKCPVVQRWLDKAVFDQSDLRVILAYHAENCEDEGYELDDLGQWSDGHIYLEDAGGRDYQAIADEGFCPIQVAETRAANLRRGELLVTTPERLGYLKDSLVNGLDVPTSELVVAFDEFHRLDSYLLTGKLELDWPDVKAAWERNVPNDLPDDGKELIQDSLSACYEVLDESLDEQVDIAQDLSELSRLSDNLSSKRHWGKKKVDMANYSETFRERFPDFKETLFAKEEGPDDLQEILVDMSREFTEGKSPQNRQGYLHAVGLLHSLEERDAFYDRLVRRLAEVFSVSISDQEPSDPVERFSFLDKLRREVASPRGKLDNWLSEKAQERLEQENPHVGSWERWAGFLARIFQWRDPSDPEDTMLIPVPRWDVDDGSVTGFEIYGVRGEIERNLSGQFTLNPSPGLIRWFVSKNVETHLLSATPPHRDFFEEAWLLFERASEPDRKPLEMTFACEGGKSRGLKKSWEDDSAKEGELSDKEKYRRLLTALVDQSIHPITFFARNIEEKDKLEAFLEEIDLSHIDVEVDYVRSLASQGVQLDEDRTIIFSGPPRVPPDLRFDLLYGETRPFPTPSDPAPYHSKIQNRMAVTELVQTAYRTARAEGSNGVIVLGPGEDIVKGLDEALYDWDYGWNYQNVTVETVSATGGKRWWEHRAKNLLEVAGVPTRERASIREAARRIRERIARNGPARNKTAIHKTDTRWTEQYDDPELDVSKEGAGYLQSERKRAVEWGLEEGLLEKDSEGRIIVGPGDE